MIDFVVAAKHTYNEKRRKSLILIACIVGILLLYFLLMGYDFVLIFGILFFMTLVQLYKSNRQIRYFIKRLTTENSSVQIIYEDRGSETSVESTLGDIVIKKETGFRSVSLAVYQGGAFLLRQCIEGDWTEAKFEEIEHYVRKGWYNRKEIG